MELREIDKRLEELREAYKNAGGVQREIIKRQAQALKYAREEK